MNTLDGDYPVMMYIYNGAGDGTGSMLIRSADELRAVTASLPADYTVTREPPGVPSDAGLDTEEAAVLPPVQALIMEVLAARERLGEPFWPFSKRMRSALRALDTAGLVSWEADISPGSYRAWLTPAGREFAMRSGYEPPATEEFWFRILADEGTKVTTNSKDDLMAALGALESSPQVSGVRVQCQWRACGPWRDVPLGAVADL